mmetsp:Transcript_12686/g.25765  ORF Transcript_12686/g.25765 Transcript_12686/m.25765 type:complete len:111 (+) Transcript_12686:438-770(+)
MTLIDKTHDAVAMADHIGSLTTGSHFRAHYTVRLYIPGPFPGGEETMRGGRDKDRVIEKGRLRNDRGRRSDGTRERFQKNDYRKVRVSGFSSKDWNKPRVADGRDNHRNL